MQKEKLSNNQRKKVGYISSIVGIILNAVLCGCKIFIGLFFNIISITADGINNLSDIGSSAISMVGYKMANKPADKKHPFGHARIEYVLSLIIGISIISIGFGLVTSSIEKLISKSVSTYNIIAMGILAGSIVLKIFLSVFNYVLYKKTDLLPLKATAFDSLTDIAATTCILITVIVAYKTKINLDGYMGILASLFIMFSGAKIIVESMHPLLGERPCKELIERIVNKINSYENVLGMHDLTIHNYGSNQNFASVHIEVDSKVDIMISHDMIDNIERDFKEQENINLIIHLDPVITDDPTIDEIKAKTLAKIKEIDQRLTLHDFRMVIGNTHSNLIFDIVIPADFDISNDSLTEQVQEKISQINSCYFAVINIDRNYIN